MRPRAVIVILLAVIITIAVVWRVIPDKNGPHHRNGKAIMTEKHAQGFDWYLGGFSNGPGKTGTITVHALTAICPPKISQHDLIFLTNAVQAVTNEPIFRIDQFNDQPVRVIVHTGTIPGHLHHLAFELASSGWQSTTFP